MPSISERHASHLTFVAVKPDVFLGKKKIAEQNAFKGAGAGFPS